MTERENYTFIQKDVKHARLRVSEDGNVRVIIPFAFSEKDVELLLDKKEKLIQNHLKFFNAMTKIHLQRNELLLYGNRYSYYYDDTYQQKVVVNHDFKTIKAKRDLLDLDIQEKWYKGIAKKHMVKRTEELAQKLNFKFNKIYIRNQRKKWGNCSADKNVSLNWRLIKAPLFVIDYLIIHELVHTEVMNHTSKFWTLLKSHFPDYKAAIEWLDKYGNSL